MLSELLIATEIIALYELEEVGHTQEGVTEYVNLQIRVCNQFFMLFPNPNIWCGCPN